MLGFFHSSGDVIYGAYNGRFVLNKNIKSTDKNFELIIDSIRSGDFDVGDKTIVHEALHHLVFSGSSLGKILVGMRFLARIKIFTKDEEYIKKYYKARAYYFIFSYKLHEDMVHDMECKIAGGDKFKKLNLSKTQSRLIKNTDNKIIKLLKNEGLFPGFFGKLVFNYLGHLAHKKIGFIIFEKNKLGFSPMVVTEKSSAIGVINSAYSPRADESFWLIAVKRFLKFFSIEEFAKFMGVDIDHEKLKKWVYLKYIGEISAINSLYKVDFSDDDLCAVKNFYVKEYKKPQLFMLNNVEKLINFSLDCFGYDRIENEIKVKDFIHEHSHGRIFGELNVKLDRMIEDCYFWYCFQHGN